MAHTPGPWQADDFYIIADPRVSVPPAYTPVAFVSGLPDYNSDARTSNARLIAAAPDLLAALNECAEFLEDQQDVVDGDYGVPAPNRAMTLLQEVNAAIAKAEGC